MNKAFNWFILTIFSIGYETHLSRQIHLTEFVSQNDSYALLQNIDLAIENSKHLKLFGLGKTKEERKVVKKNKRKVFESKFSNIKNNTLLLLGANADGLGFGTGFFIKQDGLKNSGYMLTAYHVAKHFCNIPVESMTSWGNELQFDCQNFYALNDIAINIKTNSVNIKGKNPYKSNIKELLYFDKIHDIALFKVDFPKNFKPQKIKFEFDYKVESPWITDLYGKTALKYLKAFKLYSYSFPIETDEEGNVVNDLMKKKFSIGKFKKTDSFETEDKYGLIYAFRHSLQTSPGVSGGPIFLEDGRVVAVNFSFVLNRYYENIHVKCSKAKMERITKENYAIPSTFFKNIIVRINGEKNEKN